MRIMGLDVGDCRIGVAISDEGGITAQGLGVIKNDGKVFKHLERLIESYEIKELVVGLPKKMNGELGHQANKTLKFIEAIKVNLNIPLKVWDERLTTKIAINTLKTASGKRKKQKENVDKLAAILILQNYLDYKSREKDKPEKSLYSLPDYTRR